MLPSWRECSRIQDPGPLYFVISLSLLMFPKVGGRCSNTTCRWGSIIDCWRMSQLCSGSSFLMDFGRPEATLLDLAFKSPGGKPPTTSVTLVPHPLILQRPRSGNDGQEALKPLNCRPSSQELKDHPQARKHPQHHVFFSSTLLLTGLRGFPSQGKSFYLSFKKIAL